MAKKPKKKSQKSFRARVQQGLRLVRRGLLAVVVLGILWVLAYAVLPVPTTAYMLSERVRTGEALERDWVPIEEISPNLLRAAVAAEDANFCLHHGFDMAAIRDAIADGAQRGGSTISQQTVKNTFLWHGRSWFRKALEALVTPVMETVWSKSRVLEVYLNIAEFDEGVFGAEAAAQHYFGVAATDLSLTQAARLAAVLPNPQDRSASNPSQSTQSRATSIADGARTIAADGRDDCFVD